MTASGSRLQGGGQLADEVQGEEGLVALDVDHEVFRGQTQEARRFGQAVAARRVVGAGHDGLAAEGLDALPDARVVGGHIKAVQLLNLPGLFIDPLDQGLAADQRQGLPRKAGGAEAGRDEGDEFHKLER